ncbi:Pyridoxal phosphate-dependent decarboxylase [Dillenia turbinata]|uniref:glutamate decarboxylase n=1 Tax=Dillenia turbinata TaxID=194707 RepID=A0AAN8V2K8_9MAGN
MPKNSIPKEAAYQIIKDELMLDGNPRLNLASFVTTWMEPECDKLIVSAINKNYVDMDEYPVTTELQVPDYYNQNIDVVGDESMRKHDSTEAAVGVGAVGSSEAIMLAGLAFKRKWQNKRKAEDKPYNKPNTVTGANVQVCWEKFVRYFEVELRDVRLREGYHVMDPEKAVEMVDENRVCVAPILDAASGGFIAPFLYPELEWHFRLPLVRSINVSGHKYGLVYAGIGWVIWRTKEDLPEELIFHINYLGADQPTFSLNFSKGSSQVIAQYYQLIRLGYDGYRNVMENCHENAMVLKEGLQKTGPFNIVSKDNGVPLVAFSLKDNSQHNEFEISDMLRRFGWIVPAYTMLPDAQHVTALRIGAKMSESSEEKGKNGTFVLEKTEIETLREITDAWKKFVKARKTNGVC